MKRGPSTPTHPRSTAAAPPHAPSDPHLTTTSTTSTTPARPHPLSSVAATLARETHALEQRLQALDAQHPVRRRLLQSLRTLAPSLDATAAPSVAVRTFVYTRFVVQWLASNALADAALANIPLDPHIRSLQAELHALAALEPLAKTDRQIDQLLAERRTGLQAGPDPVVYLFDRYEAALDAHERAHRGVFYTPPAVVDAVVGCIDQRLRTQFSLGRGLADTAPLPAAPSTAPFVCILDPAAGTGAFLLGVLRRVHQTFQAQTASASTTDASAGWIGFLRQSFLARLLAVEQSAPAAVAAHIRFGLALVHTGVTAEHFAPDAPVLRLTIASTLEQPDRWPHARQPLLDAPVTVVLGNPPYRREAAQGTGAHRGGWIRDGWTGWQHGRPPLLDCVEPVQAQGQGRHLKNLYNQYVYFWRWAAWRVFECRQGVGIVGFVTGASFLRGPGFAGLRQHLRGAWSCSDVIDLGGDTRGPRASDNVFGVTVPVCITVGWHCGRPESEAPTAAHRYLAVEGTRADKLATCTQLSRATDALAWHPIEGAPANPWVATRPSAYQQWPRVVDLFPWQHSGVQFKRTWPIGVSATLLQRRWAALLSHPDRARALRSTRARTIDRVPPPIDRDAAPASPLATLAPGASPPPIEPYAHRPFDRQYALADARLCDRPRAVLWRIRGPHQRYLTTLLTGVMGQGPAALVSTCVPDLHHFRGSYGGRDVIPLWRDAAATRPNLTTGLLDALEARLGLRPTPAQMMQYTYAVLAQTSFVQRFSEALQVPGARLPITTDPGLFIQGVSLGEALMDRHCTPHIAPPDIAVPTWREQPGTGALPSAEIRHVPTHAELHIGTAVLAPVSPAAMGFTVSGYPVIERWIRQRLGHHNGRRGSPLDAIIPETWAPAWTAELAALVATIEWTLGQQSALSDWLDAVLAGGLLTESDLPTPTDDDRRAPRT